MSWRGLALTLLTVPVSALAFLAVALVPTGVLIALLMLVPGLAGMATYALATSHRQQERVEDPARARVVHRRGVTLGLTVAGGTAVTVLVVAGLVVVTGPATGPILLLAGLAALPWVWTRSRIRLDRHHAARHPTSPGPVEPNPAPGPRPLVRVLETLTTAALCSEWQRSLWVLRDATDQATRDDVAGLRRRYLDELDRRDPDAMARWLAADLRPAGSSPARHLTAPAQPAEATTSIPVQE